MDLNAAITIQLCLADEVMYNMLDEKMATRLWSRLETSSPTSCRCSNTVVPSFMRSSYS